MKSALILVACCLVMMGCKLTEPLPSEQRSTAEQIRQHIAGSWTLDEGSVGQFPTMAISSDGVITIAEKDGKPRFRGTWRLEDETLTVKLTPTSDRAAGAPGSPTTFSDLLPVIHADEHHLVIAPGISAGPPMRFTK